MSTAPTAARIPRRPVETKEEAEARNLRASADRREFELMVRKGLVISKNDLTRDLTRTLIASKTKLLIIGPSLAQRLAIVTDPAECEKMVMEKVVEALGGCEKDWYFGPNPRQTRKRRNQSVGQSPPEDQC